MPKKKDPKGELLSTVIGELEPVDRFPVWIVILEAKKITSDMKMMIAHVYERDRLEFQASATSKVDQPDDKWSNTPTGSSEYSVLTFSGREKKFFEKMSDFISRSFSEGKLQDFLPW